MKFGNESHRGTVAKRICYELYFYYKLTLQEQDGSVAHSYLLLENLI